MLNNATRFLKIYIVVGYTDLRHGINGLASIIKFNLRLDLYEKDIFSLLWQTKRPHQGGGEGMDSFCFIKGWSLAVLAGSVQQKRHWRLHWNNTGIDARSGDRLQTSVSGSTYRQQTAVWISTLKN